MRRPPASSAGWSSRSSAAIAGTGSGIRADDAPTSSRGHVSAEESFQQGYAGTSWDRMPKVKKSPAFQWYPRDYMSDALVVSMTLEQEGAYRRLMDVCWLEGGLPTSIDELWRLAKAPSRDRFAKFIWPLVGRKFQPRKGKLQHKRLDRERAKQAKTRKARTLAANGRWEKERSKRDANASDLQCLTSSSSTSSSTAVDKKIKITDAARRPVENSRPPDVGAFGLYVRIAKEAREQSNRDDGSDSVSNITAIFKDLCGARNLAYDGDLAARAIDAVLREEIPA
jgi:uncharacterized protein YdaU (DUF1376 family)